MQEQVCKNCGNHFTGKFCNNCGEKVYSENSKTFSHLIEEIFHFVTHLDSKYLKTIRLVLFKPGVLSLEYCDGIRKRYFKPVSLFLIGIIIFLLLPFKQGLNMTLSTNLITARANGLGFAEKLINEKMADKNISFELLGEKYQQKSEVIAKPLLFFILPLMALALMAFFNKKRKYYFDHFILGLEISNFFLYVVFIITPLLVALLTKLTWLLFGKELMNYDFFIGPLFVLAVLLNWILAFKRFYKIKFWQALVKSILFIIPFALIVFVIYRILLFLITLLFI